MRHFLLLSVTIVAFLLVSGCYFHTVQPLTLDMHHTPVSNFEKTGSIKMFSLPPLTGQYKLFAWGSAAIGEVAKQQGMEEVYFADLEILSVLRVWNQYTVHVYGK